MFLVRAWVGPVGAAAAWRHVPADVAWSYVLLANTLVDEKGYIHINSNISTEYHYEG